MALMLIISIIFLYGAVMFYIGKIYGGSEVFEKVMEALEKKND